MEHARPVEEGFLPWQEINLLVQSGQLFRELNFFRDDDGVDVLEQADLQESRLVDYLEFTLSLLLLCHHHVHRPLLVSLGISALHPGVQIL